MADSKISALPAASTLTGSEDLAGVQSGVTVRITTQQVAKYAAASPNILTVGPTGEYSTVDAAIAAITGSGPTNPYVILIAPGTYTISSELSIPRFVTIRGAGRSATILQASHAGSAAFALNGDNITLADFKLERTTITTAQSAVRRTTANSDCQFENLWVASTGPGYGLFLSGGDNRITTFHDNCLYESESVTFTCSGHDYLTGCVIRVTGSDTTRDRIAVQQTGASRLYAQNCSVGTGYWWSRDSAGTGWDPDRYVSGETNTYGFHINATGGRTHLKNVDCITRNTSSATSETGGMKLVDGWVRMWGGTLQAEMPSISTGSRAGLIQDGGKFVTGAGRVLHSLGAAQDTQDFLHWGVRTVTAALTLAQEDSGLILADASTAAFTITLRNPGTSSDPLIPTGEHVVIKKSDSSVNAVTINPNGASIEGNTANVTLSAQWDALSIVWTGTEWVRI